MNRREIHRLDRELGKFIDELTSGMGRKERVRAMGWYITRTATESSGDGTERPRGGPPRATTAPA